MFKLLGEYCSPLYPDPVAFGPVSTPLLQANTTTHKNIALHIVARLLQWMNPSIASSACFCASSLGVIHFPLLFGVSGMLT